MNLDVLLHGQSGVRPDRVGRDGVKVPLRTQRDGAAVSQDWIHALSAEGRVYVANMGTADTAISWANTAYDADQPDLVVDVPDGVIAIPLYFAVNVVASGAAIFRASLNISPVRTLQATACAYTAITPVNARISNPRTCASTAAHSITVNGADPSAGALWLTQQGNQGDIDAIVLSSLFTWSVRDCAFLPMIEDGGSINAYIFNGTSGTGFATIAWAEVDKELFRI
jgi:hypothetical protein